jgi:hypothetical protein
LRGGGRKQDLKTVKKAKVANEFKREIILEWFLHSLVKMMGHYLVLSPKDKNCISYEKRGWKEYSAVFSGGIEFKGNLRMKKKTVNL